MTAAAPRLRVVPPAPAQPKNAFAILGPDVRTAAGDVKALAERIGRALSGPYTTTASMDAAVFQADELADAAHALSRALRRARRS